VATGVFVLGWWTAVVREAWIRAGVARADGRLSERRRELKAALKGLHSPEVLVDLPASGEPFYALVQAFVGPEAQEGRHKACA